MEMSRIKKYILCVMYRLNETNDNSLFKKNCDESLVRNHSIIIAGLNGNAVADFECSLDSADVT
jgi:hypothetical protein